MKITRGLLITICFLMFASTAMADEVRNLYVTASVLNGRSEPNKSASVESRFEYGDQVKPTGNITSKWIEVYGGETGTVWCHSDYLSEFPTKVRFTNVSGGRVRVRKTPNGKHIGWISAGKTITIQNVIDGWGKIQNVGWVDLQYFSEEYSE